MVAKFASGKHAIAECDRCGVRLPYQKLKELVIKLHNTNIRVCSECWDEDHPQLQVGMRPVYDAQALMNPRPDNSYTQSGLNYAGNPSDGSRIIYWGWNPVGLNNPLALPDLQNTLVGQGAVGSVSVSTG